MYEMKSSNFILHFTGHVATQDFKLTHVSKRDRRGSFF